jgi:hypothetical protein
MHKEVLAMKRKYWLLLLVFAVLLNCSPVLADGEFYVIAGGGPPVGTKITSLPYTISNPGFYFLVGNLTYSGNDNAITVNADNVTIDLMGFDLSYGGAAGNVKGILMGGRSNVEIRNGTVRGFNVGIRETSATGNTHRAINIRATGNGFGIFFNGNNHLIKSFSGSNNGFYGVWVDSGMIVDSICNNNGVGIGLEGPGTVRGNTAINNINRNFYLGDGVPTSILVDQNSALGLANNYYVVHNTTGVQWGINAGTP